MLFKNNCKYRLKSKYEPCLALGHAHPFLVSSIGLKNTVELTDEIALAMIQGGQGLHIFDVNPMHEIAPIQSKVITNSKVDLFQIYYNESSKKDVQSGCIGFNNQGKETVFFEGTAIAEIINNDLSNANYIGIFSHKFFQKADSKLSVQFMKAFINKYPNDVYYTHPQLRGNKQSVIQLAESYHPNFIEVSKYICEKIGLQFHLGANKHHVYSNHFIARHDIYKRYVNEVLNPAISLMSDPNEIWLQEMLFKDSMYMKGNVTAINNIKEKFGINYYPYHTFIIERFMTLWLDQQNFKAIQIN